MSNLIIRPLSFLVRQFGNHPTPWGRTNQFLITEVPIDSDQLYHCWVMDLLQTTQQELFAWLLRWLRSCGNSELRCMRHFYIRNNTRSVSGQRKGGHALCMLMLNVNATQFALWGECDQAVLEALSTRCKHMGYLACLRWRYIIYTRGGGEPHEIIATAYCDADLIGGSRSS